MGNSTKGPRTQNLHSGARKTGEKRDTRPENRGRSSSNCYAVIPDLKKVIPQTVDPEGRGSFTSVGRLAEGERLHYQAAEKKRHTMRDPGRP